MIKFTVPEWVGKILIAVNRWRIDESKIANKIGDFLCGQL